MCFILRLGLEDLESEEEDDVEIKQTVTTSSCTASTSTSTCTSTSTSTCTTTNKSGESHSGTNMVTSKDEASTCRSTGENQGEPSSTTETASHQSICDSHDSHQECTKSTLANSQKQHEGQEEKAATSDTQVNGCLCKS